MAPVAARNGQASHTGTYLLRPWSLSRRWKWACCLCAEILVESWQGSSCVECSMGDAHGDLRGPCTCLWRWHDGVELRLKSKAWPYDRQRKIEIGSTTIQNFRRQVSV